MNRTLHAVFLSPRRFDVHVDSVNGSDNNTGRTRQSAKQTLAGIGTITAGMRIGLARGSVFREQLSSSADRVVIEAYGSGERPIIDGSSAVSASEWAPTVGQPNVYEIPRTALDNPSAQHESVWTASGLAGTRASSVANCSATPGTFFSDYTAGAAGTQYKLYIHPAGSTDPRSNGITYYVGERLYCINLMGANCRVSNIHTRRQLHHDGSLRLTGANPEVTLCKGEEGYIHDIYVSGGTVNQCEANNTEAGYSLVYNPAAADARLTVNGGSSSYTTAPIGPAIFGHCVSNTRLQVNGYRAEGPDTFFSTTDGRGTLVFDRIKHKATAGSNRRTFDYQNSSNPGPSDLFLIRPDSIAYTLLYLNSLHAGSRIFVWEPVAIEVSIALYAIQCVELHVIGGLIVGTGAQGVVNLADGGGRANVTLKHNVIQLGTNEFYTTLGTGTYTLDNNVYYKPAGGDQRWSQGGTQSLSFANWQSRGFDANSVQANPLYSVAPTTISTLDGISTLFDANGKISVSSDASPLVTVGAGPGRVPDTYEFPSWVPDDIRALCMATR